VAGGGAKWREEAMNGPPIDACSVLLERGEILALRELFRSAPVKGGIMMASADLEAARRKLAEAATVMGLPGDWRPQR
jgi:hypothetical protein